MHPQGLNYHSPSQGQHCDFLWVDSALPCLTGFFVLKMGALDPWREREGEQVSEPQHILSHILAPAQSVLREETCSDLEMYLLIT